jgi:hypothetical protein
MCSLSYHPSQAEVAMITQMRLRQELEENFQVVVQPNHTQAASVVVVVAAAD